MSERADMRVRKQQGFTLVELMIAVLVLSLLLALGAPAFSNMVKNNRLLSEVYALRSILNNARSEALAQRRPVTVCSSSDGVSCTNEANWNVGYLAFVDNNRNAVVNDPNDPAGDRVFMVKDSPVPSVSIKYSNPANRVIFDSRGNASGFNGTFTLCDDRGATEARGVIVYAVGKVHASVEMDPNEPDGIVNDHQGNNLVCN